MTSPHGLGKDEMRLRIGYSPMSMSRLSTLIHEFGLSRQSSGKEQVYSHMNNSTVHTHRALGLSNLSRQNLGKEQVYSPMSNFALIIHDCYLDEELAKRVLEAEYEDGSFCPVRGWFDSGSPAVPCTSIFF